MTSGLSETSDTGRGDNGGLEVAADLPGDVAMAAVDLQALAEAVLAMMKRELRIERERIGTI
jgi:hypothetical protein